MKTARIYCIRNETLLDVVLLEKNQLHDNNSNSA